MARQKQCEQLCRVCTPSVFFLRLDRGNLGISHLINRWWKTVLHWELAQHSAVCVWSPPAVLGVPQSTGWPPSGTLMAVLLRSPQPDTLGIQPCLQCCSSREELRSQNQRDSHRFITAPTYTHTRGCQYEMWILREKGCSGDLFPGIFNPLLFESF